MKKFYFLIAVLLALLLHVPQVNADELLVADGTATNDYVPVYGWFVDATQRTQIVYPAELLEDMIDGSTISQMQFYCTQTSISWGSARWEVKIAETGDASFSTSAFKSANFQTVYTGALSVTGGIMTVTFSTPYVYHGGNLLLDFQTTSTGSYVTSTWLGVASNGAAAYSTYGTTTPSSIQNFLPKVTFTYVPGEEPDCWKAKHLSAENITANSAVLLWEDGGKSDGWYVEYRVAGDSASVVSIPDYIEETTYTLTGLNPVTLYEFRVISDCGGDPSDWTSWASFRTACASISELPYITGFEDADLNPAGGSYMMPYCWSRFNDATGSGYVCDYYPYAYSYASYAHTGSRCLEFYTTTSTSSTSYPDHQIAVLPEVDVNAHPMNTLRLRFWAKRSTTTSYADAPLIIGVMSDPTDLGTFAAVDTVLVSNTDNQEYTVYFSDYVGGAAYPAIRLDRQSAACYCFVDDVNLDVIPSCFRPTDVTLSDVTSNSVSIAWTPGNNETAWNIDYKAVNDTAWTTVPVTASPYTLGNLTPNTAYELRMQSDCGSETSEWTNPVQFKTPCAVREVTTFVEGAEGTTGDALPDCWTTDYIVKVTTNTTAPFYTQTSTKLDTRGFALRYMSSGNIAYLCSQALDFGTVGTYSFRYRFYRPSGTSYVGEGLKIMVTSTPGDTTQAVEVIPFVNRYAGNAPVGEAGAWNIYEGVINYSGVGYIMVVGYTKNGNTAYFDDLEVFLTPSCIKPANPTVVAVTTNSAEIAWENGASESAWNIGYRVVGDTSWTVVAADANPFTLTGLTANTSYECQVQADCGAGDISEWSIKAASFKTPCEIVTISAQHYFSEDFNSLTSGIPDCWDNADGTTTDASYKWTSYSSGRTGRCVRFNSFSNSSGKTNMLKTPVLSLPAQPALLSFAYKNPTGGDFSVYISTDGGVTYPTALKTAMTGKSSWTDVELSLADYANESNVVIVFKGTSNYGYNDAYIYLDDVQVMVEPTCYPVASVSTSGVGRRNFTVSWTPNAAHAENVHGYQLVIDTVELNDSALAVATPTVVDNATSYKFEGLYRNTTYHVYVRTNCGVDDGFGAWTSVAVKTNAALPIPCPQLTNFRVDSITANAAKFTWTASTADYVGDYNLHISTTEMTDSMLNELGSYTYTGADNSYYPTDLAELTQYYAYVRVNCTDGDVDDGASVWSMVPFKTNSSCPAPESVAIDSVEKYSMRVNWVMPAAMVDSSSTYTYDVEVRDSNDVVVYSFANLAPLTRSIKVTNLMRNTLYNVYVRTNCGDANSPWVMASATTPDIPGKCAIIAEGTTSSSYVPVYGSWCDDPQKVQMIYPASMLDKILGETLTQMKFFVSYGTNAYNWDTKTFNVKMGVTSAESLSSAFVSDENATLQVT